MTHYYVTLTWEDWPEGGSYDTIVKATSYAEAEDLAHQEMASIRVMNEYHPDWHVVDCSKVRDLMVIFQRVVEGPNVLKILDISTSHVTWGTSNLLDDWAETAIPNAAIVYAHDEYGWMVYVPSEMPAREDRPLIPDELWDLMVFANELDCDWILFDRDATTLDNFPVFNW